MKKGRLVKMDNELCCGDIMMSLQDFEEWDNAEWREDEDTEWCDDGE